MAIRWYTQKYEYRLSLVGWTRSHSTPAVLYGMPEENRIYHFAEKTASHIYQVNVIRLLDLSILSRILPLVLAYSVIRHNARHYHVDRDTATTNDITICIVSALFST